MPKDEVKARLAPIPVYTVANPKNEFVLVAGEVRLCRFGSCFRGLSAHLSRALGSHACICLWLHTAGVPRSRRSAATSQQLQSNTQLGFFFFRKEDAEAIIEKVRARLSMLASALATPESRVPAAPLRAAVLFLCNRWAALHSMHHAAAAAAFW